MLIFNRLNVILVNVILLALPTNSFGKARNTQLLRKKVYILRKKIDFIERTLKKPNISHSIRKDLNKQLKDTLLELTDSYNSLAAFELLNATNLEESP